jgi:dTMP kinase
MLITFEGIDGCGKSTQIDIFRKRLIDEGYDTVLLREPGGTSIGESIRNILLDKCNAGMCMETELLLFEAARAQIVRELIRPHLMNNRIVLLDRFIDSSVAYQGFGRGIGKEVVDRLNVFAIGDTVPKITFLFDIDPEVAVSRLSSRDRAKDRLDSEGLAFMQETRRGYLVIAKEDPDRVKVLDATKSIEELSHELYRIFKQLV